MTVTTLSEFQERLELCETDYFQASSYERWLNAQLEGGGVLGGEAVRREMARSWRRALRFAFAFVASTSAAFILGLWLLSTTARDTRVRRGASTLLGQLLEVRKALAVNKHAGAPRQASASVAGVELLQPRVPDPTTPVTPTATPAQAAAPAPVASAAVTNSGVEIEAGVTLVAPSAPPPMHAARPRKTRSAGARGGAAAVDPDGYARVLALANTAYRDGRIREAVQQYQAALLSNPDGAEALGRLGVILHNEGKNLEALRIAERAVRVDRSNAEAWVVIGTIRDARGDFAGSQEAYRQCVARGKGPYVSECRLLLR